MLESGTTLNDRYRLTSRLGGGGMGEVWRADDAVLGRTVAVKVLLPALMEDPRFAQRFQNEARAMATLTHPGIVDVYDCGACELGDGRRVSFLVMEFVDGESLDRLLRRSALTAEETMRLVAEVADALAAAHEHGIVHRDVKPANLMIKADGSVTLTDFGIAHSASGGQLTATGTVMCSAGYCAPEQASAGAITPAVDVYALGVVAYQCLTGALPFDGETPVQIIFKHLRAPVPPLPDDVPPGARSLVMWALEKDPAMRWASAADMAAAARHAAAHPMDDLTPVIGGEPAAERSEPPARANGPGMEPVAEPMTMPADRPRRGRRRALVVAGATLAALVATLAAVGWTWFQEPGPVGGLQQEFPVPLPVDGHTVQARVSAKQEQGRTPAGGGKVRVITPRPGQVVTVPPATTPPPTVPVTPPVTPPAEPTHEPTSEPSPEPTTPPGPQEPSPEPTVSPPSPDPQTGPGGIQCIKAPCP
ncbi:serine/threonine-protein kinase [Nonomuraea sp. NPDC059194]|uniref:serine/threonine-protein kinase n=1 Tax=Nonomuraea sp. NPDC059194 TaxID=3346764 RepID=UPI0036B16257